MKYYIYKITNKINGKIYIGFHGCDCDFMDDDYYGSGCLIKKALNKYGKDNFEREVLFVFESEEEAKTKEREIVNEEFLSQDHVYNIALGGVGGGLIGEKNPFFGKKHTEKTLQILSDKGKERSHTTETKTKISESISKSEKYKESINDDRSKKIATARRKNNGKTVGYYITPKGNFLFSSEAAKENEIPWRQLINRCEHNNGVVKQNNVFKDSKLTKDMIGKTWKELGWGFEDA